MFLRKLAGDCHFFIINRVVLKIPVRFLRSLLLSLISNGRISRSARFARDVKILNIRGLSIGAYSNINSEVILDGRGASLKIGMNVDIAPRTLIWTLEHDVDSPNHKSIAGSVIINDYVWIGSGVIILPGTELGYGSVIGAGSVFKGVAEKNGIYIGPKSQFIKSRKIRNLNFKLMPIRRFR